MSEQTNATPEKVLKTTINGEEKEIKMTYGLLNELVNLIENIDDVSKFFIDEAVRNKTLVSVFSDRTPAGKITTKINLDESDIELEDIDAALSWASAHVTGFFIRSLTNLAKRVQAMPTTEIQAGLDAVLTATQNGSKP